MIQSSYLPLWGLIAFGSFIFQPCQAQIIGGGGIRVAMVRDSIFIEGGSLYTGTWVEGHWSNTDEIYHDNTLYRLPLSQPFNVSGGTEAPVTVHTAFNSSYPNYLFGSIAANENGFFTFGGGAETPPINQSVVRMVQFYNGTADDTFNTTFLDAPVTDPSETQAPDLWRRYGTSDVSIPSEALAYSFGGQVSNDSSIVQEYSDSDLFAVPVRDMIQCNTTVLSRPKCQQLPLPDHIVSRIGGGLSWLPIGNRGILACFGGENKNERLYTVDNLTEIRLYDIDSSLWFTQTVESAVNPPPMIFFCTVVAYAQDRSVFNIYLYGGSYQSENSTKVYDDVWILSLPSFQWFRATTSSVDANHGRYLHKCESPYPNLMLTLGGLGSQDTNFPDSFIDVFDMNELRWTGKYDPLNWTDYKIPSMVSAVIGGNEKGGAKLFAQNMHPDLKKIFKTPYKRKIPQYYPYARKSLRQYLNSVPVYLRINIIVVAYLGLASLAFVAILVIRRRMHFQAAHISASPAGSPKWLVAWMHNAEKSNSQFTRVKTTDVDSSDTIRTHSVEQIKLEDKDQDPRIEEQDKVGLLAHSISRLSKSSSLLDDIELRAMLSPKDSDFDPQDHLRV